MFMQALGPPVVPHEQRRRFAVHIGVLAVCLLCRVTSAADSETVYHIGNSLMWDTHPPTIWKMSEDLETSLTGGFHMRAGSTLSQIATSEGTTVSSPAPYGIWQEALPDHEWDHVIVQPMRSCCLDNNVESDVAAIGSFVDAALQQSGNDDTRWWIYQSWAYRTDTVESWNDWLAPVPGNEATRHRRAYYEKLQDRLAGEALPIEIIPTADVMYRVVLHADQYDWVSSWRDLYRDDIHLSDVGKFLVGSTVLAALSGGPVTDVFRGTYGPRLAEPTRDAIQSLAWDVVNHYQNPGDFDQDGDVDQDDYVLWRADFGGDLLSADVTLDGVVDAADYTRWRDQVAAAAATPEPTSLALVLGCVLAIDAHRRRATD